MREPYIVLGQYVPTIWEARRIGEEILSIIAATGFTPAPERHAWPGAAWRSFDLNAEVRGPELPDSTDHLWHQDGNIDWVPVIWSTSCPTEIVLADSLVEEKLECECCSKLVLRPGTTIFQPKPFEIIAFENKKVFHRRPAEATTPRWFFRHMLFLTFGLQERIAMGTLREQEEIVTLL